MLQSFDFLNRAENRATFFARIEEIFPCVDPRYKLIRRAYDAAKDAFREIEREGGERYFEHLRAVTLILIDHLRVRNPELIVAALLHDVVEDKDEWTIERVEREFGEFVGLLVAFLSKPRLEQYGSKEARDAVYHRRFESAPREFFIIKLPDRLHNLLTLNDCSIEKQKRKIEETKLFYLPYAEREIILIHELEAAIKSIETGWEGVSP